MSVRTCIGTAVLALALALAACSSRGEDQPHASTAPASEWLAVARGQVDVQGGMVQVVALARGVVVSVKVEQGEHVTAGQVLARLDARAAENGVAVAKSSVAQAEAKLTELKASLAQATWSAEHLAAAAKDGTATGAAAVQAKATVATLKAQQDAAKAALDASRHQLAGAQLELDETKLRAPVAGMVVTRDIALGQAVAPAAGPALFTLLPDAPLIVRAQVDAQAAIHLRAGSQAEVERDSGLGPVYSATVVSVGKVLQSATLAPSPLERALADDVDCTLKLVPPKPGVVPLNVGQRVVVRFPRPR